MKHRLIIATLGLLLPWLAGAQTEDRYRCLRGDLERRVEIFYEPGRAVPCEVHYYKDSESPGKRQVLWRAQNESGFCESKTRDFIAQLESEGWDCSAGAAEPAAPAAADGEESAAPPDDSDMDEAVDDTDALVPAGEPDKGNQQQ